MSTVTTKPYLIRAIHEWCVDQGFTPYLAAMVDGNTLVPPGSARDGQIVLNVSYDATQGLELGNEMVSFQARFGGVAQHVAIPVANVLAVYARENGQGMAFEILVPSAGDDEVAAPQADAMDAAGAQDEAVAEPPDTTPPTAPSAGRGAHLKRIK